VSLRLRWRETGEEWPLVPGADLGRLSSCAILVPDPSVSRRHARVEAREDGLWLVDLGSSNGTRHNGRRVRECPLRPGDLLTLGAVALDVVGEAVGPVEPEEAPREARSGPDLAAAERARLRAELRRLEHRRGPGDLDQLALSYQIRAVLLGRAVLAGAAWAVVHLGGLLGRG